MIDEEQHLVSYLRNPGHDFRGDLSLEQACGEAADEIERLEQELSHREIDIETQADEIERLVKENGQLKDIIHQMNCDLMEAKRHDMRDWHNALERGRKNPI